MEAQEIIETNSASNIKQLPMERLAPKIMFVYPPITVQERYSSSIGNSGGKQIPLGIYYLASYMRSKGYEVMAIDAETENLDISDIIKIAAEFSPDFIGISSTTVAFHRALDVAEGIKKCMQVTIILGGPHITSNYSHAMSFPVFDYGVYGEGEITLYELCESLLNKGDCLNDILGVIQRNEAGEVIKNEPRAFIDNLDEIPFPAYDLVPDINKYVPTAAAYRRTPVRSIITARGCPGQCTFCDRNVFGNRHRKRSAQNIFDEIMLIKDNYGFEEIAFGDDSFLIDKNRIYELFSMLKNAGISFQWTCLGRINDLNEELVKFIKRNGCWRIIFGIESGDESILKIIKKYTTNEKVQRAISLCRKYGIKTGGFFIIGHPSETVESIEKTIEFALSLPLDDITVTINTPIPGSVQYDEALKYGTLDETDWSQYNYWRPVFVPHGLTQEILLEKQKEFYRRFYLRPRILFGFALSLLGTGGIRRILSLSKSAFYLFKKA